MCRTYVGSDDNKTGISQRQWQWWQCGYEDSVNKARARAQWRLRPAQVRQGQCNDGVTTEVTRERENG
jgi:hypothetical protein